MQEKQQQMSALPQTGDRLSLAAWAKKKKLATDKEIGETRGGCITFYGLVTITIIEIFISSSAIQSTLNSVFLMGFSNFFSSIFHRALS